MLKWLYICSIIASFNHAVRVWVIKGMGLLGSVNFASVWVFMWNWKMTGYLGKHLFSDRLLDLSWRWCQLFSILCQYCIQYIESFRRPECSFLLLISSIEGNVNALLHCQNKGTRMMKTACIAMIRSALHIHVHMCKQTDLTEYDLFPKLCHVKY